MLISEVFPAAHVSQMGTVVSGPGEAVLGASDRAGGRQDQTKGTQLFH